MFLGTQRCLKALLQLSPVLINEVIILERLHTFGDRDDLFHLCTPMCFEQKLFSDDYINDIFFFNLLFLYINWWKAEPNVELNLLTYRVVPLTLKTTFY